MAWTGPAPGNHNIIQTVYISPAGVPGTVADRTEPTENSSQPGVAVNKGGDATLTWRQAEGSSFSVRSRLIPDSAPVDTIRNLGTCEITTPDVIALPDGAFRVAWVTGAGATAKVVSRRLTGGVPEPLQDISAIGSNASDPDLEAGSDGRVAVVWSRNVNSRWVTEMNRIDATGAPGTAFQISAGTHDAFSPRVGIGPDGTASVAWSASRGNPAVHWIEAARVSPLNVPGGVKKLSADYSSVTGPEISVGGGGTATVVWTEFLAATDAPVESARISPLGIVTGPTVVSKPPAVSANSPMVVTATDDTALAVYEAFEAVGGKSVWTSRFTDPGLTIAPASTDFGRQQLNSKSRPRTVTITNSGSTPNFIYGVNLNGIDFDQFTVHDSGGCVGPIAAGDSCEPQYAFLPSSTGRKSVTVEVSSAVPVTTAVLAGTATDVTALSLKAKPKTRKVRRGKKAKLKVMVSNGGSFAARSVKLCLNAGKKLKPKKKCVKLGTVAAGKSKRRTFRIGPKSKAKKGKKFPVRFRLTAANAPARKAMVKLKVK